MLVGFLFLAGLGVLGMAANLPVLVLLMARLGRADRESARVPPPRRDRVMPTPSLRADDDGSHRRLGSGTPPQGLSGATACPVRASVVVEREIDAAGPTLARSVAVGASSAQRVRMTIPRTAGPGAETTGGEDMPEMIEERLI